MLWGIRSKSLSRGMIDTTNLDTISAKIEAVIDKKLSKLSLTGSSNTPLAREKHFACSICWRTNHDTSYYGSSLSKHLVEVDYGGYNPEAPVTSYDGYDYNPDHVAVVNYGGQGAGYVQQPLTNQSYRPPFNSNQSQGNFNPGYNQNVQSGYNNQGFQGNQPSGNAPRPSSFRPLGFNLGPKSSPNLSFFPI